MRVLSQGLRVQSVSALLAAAAALALSPHTAHSAEITDARKLLNTGKYPECIAACDAGIEDRPALEQWYLIKIRAQMDTGAYAGALKTYEEAVRRHSDDIAVRLAGYEIYRLNDLPRMADGVLEQIANTASRAPWRYSDPSSRLAIGRVLLLGGADPRQVLELFYDQVKKTDPQSPEPFLASGELALAKHDYAVAADAFQGAIKLDADNPDAYYGLARSFENTPGDKAEEALAKALELNPRHVDSLLFQVDNLIDREDYTRASSILADVAKVNPNHPRLWAYRAVLAHLAGNTKEEQANRDKALAPWTNNPEVDHLIGKKLSAKYRFAEGAKYQRQSIQFMANYAPARAQLAQDLLRLGVEGEGWQLASDVFAADKYDVVAYNLVTLHDVLSKFSTLGNEHFVVRMEAREAQIYGERVLRLLERARERLTSRYNVKLDQPTTVEIFPQQKDFAIRTFGLPGGDGYLGVCFGPVVTINSPASRLAHPANWEAIAWHEFCHTVTLTKTRNKMPRWLSEGISVYEEKRENPAWGQAMTPQYRELILKGEATPVSKLSGAFLAPPSPMHLQFAYYESSMVVEYVVANFGSEALGKILDALATDVPINDALARHTVPIEELDKRFDQWLREKAEGLAPSADWARPDLPLDSSDSAAFAAWLKDHPNGFYGLLGLGQSLLGERKWEEAKAPLKKAIELYPSYGEAGGPYLLLAAAHRELGETKEERASLEKHLALDADAIEPRVRVIEIAKSEKDWKAVRQRSEEIIATNPLVAPPHGYLAESAEGLGDRPAAIEARRTLLLLDPLDVAEHRYKLASLLSEEGKLPEARVEVIKALEEAPRYRAGHRLLLQITEKMASDPAASLRSGAGTPTTTEAR